MLKKNSDPYKNGPLTQRGPFQVPTGPIFRKISSNTRFSSTHPIFKRQKEKRKSFSFQPVPCMAQLRCPPLHLTLLPSSSLPSKKHSSLSSPPRFHAPSTTLTWYLSPANRSLLPFYLTVRLASAVIQSTSSETESRTRLTAQNVPWTSTLDEARRLFDRYGIVADVEVCQFFFLFIVLAFILFMV